MKTLHRSRGLTHDLVVTQEGNEITLWSASGLRHTVFDLSAPHMPGLEYARSTLVALAFSPRAQSILMLGLGGGSIPQMLRAARPDAAIDAVEIDPGIPDIARKFFQLGSSPRFQVYVEDAANYLARCEKQYDVIILDAYVGDVLPAQCTTREFFANARCRLAKHGVLVINWMRGDQERYRNVLTNVEDSIGSFWLLHCYRSRNIVIFVPLREIPRRELLAEAERLGRALPFPAPVARLARQLKMGSDKVRPRLAI